MKRYCLFLLCIVIHMAGSGQQVITVASDGTGKYETIQSAFDAVPYGNKKPITIKVSNGIYMEKLVLDSTKDFVTLEGESKFNTIIRFNDHTGKISPRGDTINTYTSETVLIKANNFTAKNISFENTAGYTAGQAVAVQAAGDKQIFSNCRFIGNQDVLFTPKPSTRQYFTDCYIEGTTDFIFGASTAWFERSHIHSKKNSHVTAAATPSTADYGYVFNECILTGDTALRNVSLGRPWRAHAAVVFLNSYIGGHIRAEGWSVWNNNTNHTTSRYAEYNNFGPSSSPRGRVSWSKQLSGEDAEKYTLKNVFKNWNPLSE